MPIVRVNKRRGLKVNAVDVLGGGLAGCEAACYLARHGIPVRLWEMRPKKNTPAHQTGDLAELVCSNSLKSEVANTAQGLLKREMQVLGSLLLECAAQTRVPAGSALAVDRRKFAQAVTCVISQDPNITIIREEARELVDNGLTIVATGPLTSNALSRDLQRLNDEDSLHFFDAIAPSVLAESLDYHIIYRASRYGKGTADYLNCPMNQAEYERFYEELINADIKEGHSIDMPFFQACMPVEVLARSGPDTMRFGPLRPVGLEKDPNSARPYAVVQLRQEDAAGRIYGLVGFQTRLRWGEQDRVFRLIPGLENAEFVRYGSIHRNTFINSPRLLLPTLQWNKDLRVFFAGQITGVEGYMESAATGIVAGINAYRYWHGQKPITPPPTTMLGALIKFITGARDGHFQPINANFGLLPSLETRIKDKQKRYQVYAERALRDMDEFSELL
ncbi:MAG: methylenetetrahydrofolate--tRNA-(uracil(54)-C(5))-methyltransferase (FADH(2)-oxidizing) TrmFO [Syntrophomonas sp.]